MIENIKGYSYNDLTIVPSVISNISSRSQCCCWESEDFLPIWTAPMASVISPENSWEFERNGIHTIIPRNIPIEKRIECMNECYKSSWVALSLKEFEDLFITHEKDRTNKWYGICVDIANGHMKKLYDICMKAKTIANDKGSYISIMTGNIANPETYRYIVENFNIINKEGKKDCIIDYIRVGIGGGSGCFIDGTKITTKNGFKNIEYIQEGDYVLTIDGTYQKVLNTTRFKSNELIKINNEITSTTNHEYFVINKEDKDKVNENNLQKYGYWVPACKLNKNIHLLVKYKINFIEIKDIEYLDNYEYVNDLTIENNHNYIANNYIVHNCITTSNVSIHYPQASLINETYKVKEDLKMKSFYFNYGRLPEIIADGGIRNYDHVIKALALGADGVMIGSLFAQCIESAGVKANKNLNQKISTKLPISRYKDFYKDDKGNWWGHYTDEFIEHLLEPWKEAIENTIEKYGELNNEVSEARGKYNDKLKDLVCDKFIGPIDVKFFGMASADGQKSIDGEKKKTAEGITKWLPVKYTIAGWSKNMESYLCSAMSYCDCKTLIEFIGKPMLIVNSISEIQAVNK